MYTHLSIFSFCFTIHLVKHPNAKGLIYLDIDPDPLREEPILHWMETPRLICYEHWQKDN